MHLTILVPNVTSLDIKARIAGLKYIQKIGQRKRQSGHWESEEWNEPEMEKEIEDGNTGANGVEVTQSNGEGDHVISN